MYALSSSVSARNSAMSTPVSTASTTTPVSDTAGLRRGDVRRSLRWAWSLTTKAGVLAIVFLTVPAFLYSEFRSAYEESQELLLRSVREEGRAISQSLLPLLETVDSAALPELGRHLSQFAGEVTTIKLLLRPAGTGTGSDGFYYLASWPLSKLVTAYPSSTRLRPSDSRNKSSSSTSRTCGIAISLIAPGDV